MARALVVLLLLAGCVVPEIPLDGKGCDDEHACVDGFTCVEGRCVSGAPDPTPPDASTPADAATPPVRTVSADRSAVTADMGPFVADGAAAGAVHVTLVDGEGQPMPGVQVVLSTSTAGAVLVQPPATDASGTATGTVSSTRAGTVTVKVAAGGVTLAAAATVPFIAGLPSASRTTLAADPVSVVADGAAVATLTVTALDAFSNPVPGATVSLASTGTKNTLTQPAMNTDKDGRATGTLSSTLAEVKSLSATVAGVAVELHPTVTFVPGAPSPAHSTVVAAPAQIEADGQATSTITVSVRDATDNPLPGQQVTLTATGTGNSLTQPATTTSALGVTTGTLASIDVGKKDVRASVGGVDLGTATVDVVPRRPSPTLSTLTVSPAEPLADGNALASIVLVARDAGGNLLGGRKVSLTVSGTGNGLSASSGTTAADGSFKASLSSTVGETKSVLADVDGVALQTSVTFIGLPEVLSITPPATATGGCVPVKIAVRQAQGRRVSLIVEYDPIGNASTWVRATQAGGSDDGLDGITSAAGPGVTHTFLWNSTADRPGRGGATKLRVTPSLRGVAGTPVIQSVSLANGLAFGTQQPAALPSSPGRGATGDFDRDGKLDLAVVTPAANAVAVLLGKGDGTFAAPVSYTVGTSPQRVVVADFNRDGKPDLATADQGTKDVVVLLGAGDGTFTKVATATSLTAAPLSLAAADFNRDGIADLAVANASTSAFVLLGKGDGTFLTPASVAAGGNQTDIVVADLNADGFADLAATVSGSVSVMLGRASAQFAPAVLYAAGTSGQDPRALVVADLDLDGKLDVATANYATADLSVFNGVGDGTLRAAKQLVGGTLAGSLSAADLNGDGRPDLVTVDYNSRTLDVAYASGALLFGPTSTALGFGAFNVTTGDFNGDGAVDVAVLDPAGRVVVLPALLPKRCDAGLDGAQELPVGASPSALVAGDFNGDGKLDLVTGSAQASFLNMAFGLGNGGLRDGGTVSFSSGVAALVAEDFDEDGALDLAGLTATQVGVLHGKGNGTFDPGAVLKGTALAALVPGDFDGDGHRDLAVATAGGVDLYGGKGDGTFRAPVSTALSLWKGGLVAGDFNGDGHLDLAALGQQSVVLLTGDGTLHFQAQPAATVCTGTVKTLALTAADLNGDGRSDLVVVLDNGRVATLFGFGNGTLGSLATSGGNNDYSARAVLAADFTSDTRPDVVVMNADGFDFGWFSVKPGASGGALQPDKSLLYTQVGLRGMTTGDFNSDGRLDLAFIDELTSLAMVGLGTGDGSFRLGPEDAIDHGMTAVLAADLNRDGFSDAVTTVNGVWNHWTTLGSATGLVDLGGTDYVNPATGATLLDANGDGKLDLASTHEEASSPALELFTGDGSGRFAMPIIYPTPNVKGLLSADFNLDGRPDVVTLGRGTASLFPGNGNGFGAASTVAVGAGSVALTVADVDRDGRPDLVTANQTPPSLTVMTALATTTGFAAPAQVATPPAPSALCAGDFNGDGRVDFAVASVNSTSLTVLYGGSTGYTSATVPAGVVPSSIVAVDLNRDGRLDLLVTSAVTGDVAILFGNGSGFDGAQRVSSTPGAVSLATGDFDRDGLLDAVVVGLNGLGPRLLRGR